jgi:hypothetical protein
MKKGVIIFLFSSAILSSEISIIKNSMTSLEKTEIEFGIHFLVNSTSNREDVNVGFYAKKRVKQSPLLNQPVDFSVGQMKLKKAVAYLGSNSTTNYYLGNLFEGLSGKLLFGSKQRSVDDD